MDCPSAARALQHADMHTYVVTTVSQDRMGHVHTPCCSPEIQQSDFKQLKWWSCDFSNGKYVSTVSVAPASAQNDDNGSGLSCKCTDWLFASGLHSVLPHSYALAPATSRRTAFLKGTLHLLVASSCRNMLRPHFSTCFIVVCSISISDLPASAFFSYLQYFTRITR
jgi:hypothetical protein